MTLNLNKKILNIKGETTKLTFPSEKVMESLPKTSDGKPDTKMLPDDDYRNVLITCLSTYATKDKREVMWVSALATQIINAGDEVELSDKHKKFLIDVLYAQTFQASENGERHGIYMSWVISQILTDLGVSQEN